MSRRPPPSPAPQETKRAAIYTRKSTTMGLEQSFNSLDAQYESCLAYIQRQQGWKLVEERYDDGGFTGANTDRPAFQRLLADIDGGKVDVIVVYKVDRLSRSLLDFVKVMERLSKSNASFVSVTQNFSTADAMGRLTMNMLMSFAEFERTMIAERTRDKIAASRRKGKWTGGPVPFGYSAKDKKLYVNDLEAHVVREAFSLLLQHRQMTKVAQELNELGLLPRGRKSRPAKRGLLWTKESVKYLLKNPLYAGFMMYGDELHPGEHPSLISEATYREAQAILGDTLREIRLSGRNPEYLLRGLLTCGMCGEPMTTASTHRGGKTYRYYRCQTREKFGKGHCKAKELPAHAIEAFVVERITVATADGTLSESIRATLMARIERERETLEKLRAVLPDQVAEASAAANKLVDGVATLDGHARVLVEDKLRVEADRLAGAQRQLDALADDTADLDRAAREVKWIAGALRDFGKVWDSMTSANQRRLLRALVAGVRVDEESGDCTVELVNFAAEDGTKEAA